MRIKLLRFIERLKKKPPVTEAMINAFIPGSGTRLPDEYLEFLRISDGIEGFIGKNSYVIFWPLEELLELNKAYQVNEYAPGLFLFGSDGGGEAYAFDTRSSMSIVRVPFVGMGLNEVRPIAPTFSGFLEVLENA
jgi:hypothetical protein